MTAFSLSLDHDTGLTAERWSFILKPSKDAGLSYMETLLADLIAWQEPWLIALAMPYELAQLTPELTDPGPLRVYDEILACLKPGDRRSSSAFVLPVNPLAQIIASPRPNVLESNFRSS